MKVSLFNRNISNPEMDQFHTLRNKKIYTTALKIDSIYKTKSHFTILWCSDMFIPL